MYQGLSATMPEQSCMQFNEYRVLPFTESFIRLFRLTDGQYCFCLSDIFGSIKESDFFIRRWLCRGQLHDPALPPYFSAEGSLQRLSPVSLPTAARLWCDLAITSNPDARLLMRSLEGQSLETWAKQLFNS